MMLSFDSPLTNICWLTAFSALLLGTARAASCSLCGSSGHTLTPEQREIAFDIIEGLPIETCGELEDTMPIMPPEICSEAQRVATFCGCPVPTTKPCTICYDGSDMTQANSSLDELDMSGYLSLAPEGVEANCFVFKHILETFDEESQECRRAQLASTPCGCAAPPPDVFDDLEEQEDVEKDEPCSLCTNGQAVTMPDRELSFGPKIPVSTCSDLAAFAALVGVNSEECPLIQSLGTLCGCPASEEFGCTLCPNGERVPNPQQESSLLAHHGHIGQHFFADLFDGTTFTCEIVEAVMQNPPVYGGISKKFMCFGGQFRSSACGCSPSSEQKWSNWSFRISGSMSLIGSLVVLCHVLKTKKNRDSTYHQLMGGISFYDCISSIAYILGASMVQKEEGFYQSVGNDATCTAQGFMLQLGLTALFFNMALSVYFYLVVGRNWREFHFTKFRWYGYIAFSVVGVALACAAIPLYEPQWGYCYVTRPSLDGDGWVAPIFFFILPVCFMILTVTIMVALLYWKVYQQQKRASKWTMKNSRMDVTRKVFWSSFFYLLAAYIAWPYVVATQIYNGEKTENSWWWILFGFVAPSQGVFNSMIYFYWVQNNSIKVKRDRKPSNRRRRSSFLGELTRRDESDTMKTSGGSNHLSKMLSWNTGPSSLRNPSSITNSSGHNGTSGNVRNSSLNVVDSLEDVPSFASHHSEASDDEDDGLGIDEMGEIMGLVEFEQEQEEIETNKDDSIEPRLPPTSARPAATETAEQEALESGTLRSSFVVDSPIQEEERRESFDQEFEDDEKPLADTTSESSS